MDKEDKPAAPALYGCHLGMAQYRGDTPTPEERAAAQAIEFESPLVRHIKAQCQEPPQGGFCL